MWRRTPRTYCGSIDTFGGSDVLFLLFIHLTPLVVSSFVDPAFFVTSHDLVAVLGSDERVARATGLISHELVICIAVFGIIASDVACFRHGPLHALYDMIADIVSRLEPLRNHAIEPGFIAGRETKAIDGVLNHDNLVPHRLLVAIALADEVCRQRTYLASCARITSSSLSTRIPTVSSRCPSC
ncbi:hypothetical protein OE88DRAFT_209659 [Heliocybe sulcata]|uniref:Uncharacterized protein n=1 Tax=Heliocybe sulcata TaxID=5364 RepID=A0A5C3MZZ1_9AGAM|nr:hypothetical protein OE88DRAFT_209659 [Heliocybe sulcata]